MFGRIFREQERRSLLFGEMLRRFGPQRDMTMTDALALRRAIIQCRACRAADSCEAWQQNNEGVAGSELFCPNVGTFRQLAGG